MIGGYEVVRELSGAGSVLAIAPGNRQVVLKTLDPDCLQQGGSQLRLHPSIRDRLARVQELAHGRVANLHGVERDGGAAYLIWEFVAGKTLEEWAQSPEVSPRDLLLAARELTLMVEALHARGIVHGAIHGSNVIVDEMGKLKLTHISPLLYTEPRNDLDAVAELLGHLASCRGAAGSALRALATEAATPEGTPRTVGARAAALIDLRRDDAPDPTAGRADAHRRVVSRLAALVAAALAVLLAMAIRRYAASLSPEPPRPPVAPREMLE